MTEAAGQTRPSLEGSIFLHLSNNREAIIPASLMDRRRRHSLSSLHASAPFSSTMAIRADPWRLRVIDANGLALAHLYGQPPDAVAFSDKRLTNDEAEKLARLIARPEPGRRPWEISYLLAHLFPVMVGGRT